MVIIIAVSMVVACELNALHDAMDVRHDDDDDDENRGKVLTNISIVILNHALYESSVIQKQSKRSFFPENIEGLIVVSALYLMIAPESILKNERYGFALHLATMR
jgi:hypothetical protein